MYAQNNNSASIARFCYYLKTAILRNCTGYQTMCVLFLLHNFKFKHFSLR